MIHQKQVINYTAKNSGLHADRFYQFERRRLREYNSNDAWIQYIKFFPHKQQQLGEFEV